MYRPTAREEVEAGYIFLYLYSRDAQAASQQIDAYLKEFPNADRAEIFKKVRSGINESGIRVKSN